MRRAAAFAWLILLAPLALLAIAFFISFHIPSFLTALLTKAASLY